MVFGWDDFRATYKAEIVCERCWKSMGIEHLEAALEGFLERGVHPTLVARIGHRARKDIISNQDPLSKQNGPPPVARERP